MGEVRGRVAGPGWVKLAAAVGSSSVVAGFVLGQDRRQMPLAEVEHPGGDLGPGGAHEEFRVSARTRVAGRDLHGPGAGIGQDGAAGLVHPGRGLARRSMATSCRSTSSPAFSEADGRPGRTSQPQSRTKMR